MNLLNPTLLRPKLMSSPTFVFMVLVYVSCYVALRGENSLLT